MDDTKQLEVFSEVCARLNVPWDLTGIHWGRGVSWDGRVMNGRIRWGQPADMDDLWHELGHWLLCEPEYRRYIGFGMGPAGDMYYDRVGDGPNVSQVDEGDASAVGILMQSVLSLQAAEEHATIHNWDEYDYDRIGESALSQLNRYWLGAPFRSRQIGAQAMQIVREVRDGRHP